MTNILLLEIVLFLIAGCLAGTLSSLFGIGGGLVIVPTLYWIFKLEGLAPYFIMHLAAGTSLAVMIVTVMNSVYLHHKKGNVLWPVVKVMMPPMALAVILGSVLSHYLSSEYLRYLFIAFLIYTILNAVFKKHFTAPYNLSDFVMPQRAKLMVLSFITGCVSVLLGVGGSVMIVPSFRKAKMPMKNAAATAVALVPVVALIGTAGYIIAGWHAPALPHYALGFVYVPAFFGIALGTFLGVPIGARLAQKLPDHLSAKIYVGMLVMIVLSMII